MQPCVIDTLASNQRTAQCCIFRQASCDFPRLEQKKARANWASKHPRVWKAVESMLPSVPDVLKTPPGKMAMSTHGSPKVNPGARVGLPRRNIRRKPIRTHLTSAVARRRSLTERAADHSTLIEPAQAVDCLLSHSRCRPAAAT
jgi:hypothetical protein